MLLPDASSVEFTQAGHPPSGVSWVHPRVPPNSRGRIPLHSDSEPASGPAGFGVMGRLLFPCPRPFPSARRGVFMRRLRASSPRPRTDRPRTWRAPGKCIQTALFFQNDHSMSARLLRLSPGMASGVTSWELHVPTRVHVWERTCLHARVFQQSRLCHMCGCEGIR